MTASQQKGKFSNPCLKNSKEKFERLFQTFLIFNCSCVQNKENLVNIEDVEEPAIVMTIFFLHLFCIVMLQNNAFSAYTFKMIFHLPG